MYSTILSLAVTAVITTASTFTMPTPGGPPRIAVSGKTGGDIDRATWMQAKAVELHGCVAGVKVTALTLHITDCTGGPVTVRTLGGTITKEMHVVVNNLAPGTAFTLKVEAKDGAGKTWEVPDARYVWKG